MSKKSVEAITYQSVDGTAENRDSTRQRCKVSFVFSEMYIEVSQLLATITALMTGWAGKLIINAECRTHSFELLVFLAGLSQK